MIYFLPLILVIISILFGGGKSIFKETTKSTVGPDIEICEVKVKKSNKVQLEDLSKIDYVGGCEGRGEKG